MDVGDGINERWVAMTTIQDMMFKDALTQSSSHHNSTFVKVGQILTLARFFLLPTHQLQGLSVH